MGSTTSAREQASRAVWNDEAQRRYTRIHELVKHRHSIAAIARTVGVSRQTVYRYLHMTEPPEHSQIRTTRQSILDPAKPYIIERWNAGCRNGHQLWRELQAQGIRVSQRTINRFIAALRHASGCLPQKFRQQPAGMYFDHHTQQHRPLTALEMMRVVMTDPQHRSAWDQAYLEQVMQQEPRVQEAETLVQAFCQMTRHRTGNQLDTWLVQAQESSIGSLRRFALGLIRDEAAVKAGLTLPWSNGQTEAQIQRLKVIKRQFYGRAGFALLRKRILYRGVQRSD